VAEETKTKKKFFSRLSAAWPEVWALVRPRLGLLAGGFVLMVINRVAGLVLPYSPKILVDDVINKHRPELLPWLIFGVLGATAIQGLTSFSLTQLLSKAGQRAIAELRRKVQAHIGRLPVAYYDSNKTGALVSRIMSDVEGVRNLIGTAGRIRWRFDDSGSGTRLPLPRQPADDAPGVRIPGRLRIRSQQSIRHHPSDLS